MEVQVCGTWGGMGCGGAGAYTDEGTRVKFGAGVTAVSARHGVPREGFSREGGGFYYYDR